MLAGVDGESLSNASCHPEYRIINADKLPYAGDTEKLRDIADAPNDVFEQADICDYARMKELFSRYAVDGVIHLAAESHVDRSIDDPFVFARTNVMGTLTLLQAAKKAWQGAWAGKRFCYVSTDEAYSALGPEDEAFTESTPYAPHSPYSASKAASDHFVRAFHDTYGLPVVLTHSSNNYGPGQYPEKLLPLMVERIRDAPPCPSMARA